MLSRWPRPLLSPSSGEGGDLYHTGYGQAAPDNAPRYNERVSRSRFEPLPLLGWRWLVLAGGAYGLRWLALLPGYPVTTVLPSVTLLAILLFALGTMGTRGGPIPSPR